MGNAAHATSGGSNGGGSEWRKVKKGASVGNEGKTWHWCPQHYKEGLFIELYMPHKPEDRDEWAQKKNQNAEKRKKNKSGSSGSDGGGSGNKKMSKLQLTDGMKQSLVS